MTFIGFCREWGKFEEVKNNERWTNHFQYIHIYNQVSLQSVRIPKRSESRKRTHKHKHANVLGEGVGGVRQNMKEPEKHAHALREGGVREGGKARAQQESPQVGRLNLQYRTIRTESRARERDSRQMPTARAWHSGANISLINPRQQKAKWCSRRLKKMTAFDAARGMIAQHKEDGRQTRRAANWLLIARA